VAGEACAGYSDNSHSNSHARVDAAIVESYGSHSRLCFQGRRLRVKHSATPAFRPMVSSYFVCRHDLLGEQNSDHCEGSRRLGVYEHKIPSRELAKEVQMFGGPDLRREAGVLSQS